MNGKVFNDIDNSLQLNLSSVTQPFTGIENNGEHICSTQFLTEIMPTKHNEREHEEGESLGNIINNLTEEKLRIFIKQRIKKRKRNKSHEGK